MTKRFLCAFISAAMIISCASAAATAAETELPRVSVTDAGEEFVTAFASEDTGQLTAEQIEEIKDATREALEEKSGTLDVSDAGIKLGNSVEEYNQDIINADNGEYSYAMEVSHWVVSVIENYLADNPEYFYAQRYEYFWFEPDVADDGTVIMKEITAIYYHEPFGIYEFDEDGYPILETVTVDEEAISTQAKLVEDNIQMIIDEMNAYGIVTDFDRALWLHDYLINRFSYDNRFYSKDHFVRESANRYLNDVLYNNVSVCSGYAAVYKTVLKRLGMECMSAYNNVDGHEWVIVKVNGNWYHVDPTFDDPTFETDPEVSPTAPDQLGYVSHELFLLTDDEIKTHDNHSDWFTTEIEDVKCTDKTYSNAAWHTDVKTPAAFVNGSIYYAEYTKPADQYSYPSVTIYKCGAELSEPAVFLNIPNIYWSVPDAERVHYNEYFGGMGAFGKYLYINSENGILRIDTTAAEPAAEQYYTHENVNEKLFGSCVIDRTLYYGIGSFRADEEGNTVPCGTVSKKAVNPTLGYTVTFDSNGGDAVSPQHAPKGEALTAPEVNRPGYELAGWYTDDELQNEWDFTQPVTGDMTLYADWVKLDTVTFMSGNDVLGTVTLKDGEKAEIPNYTKLGSVIENWYTEAEFTTAWDFAQPITGDMTLYANWADAELPEESEYMNCLTAGEDSAVTGTIDVGIRNLNPAAQQAPAYMLAIYENGSLTAAKLNVTGKFDITEEDGIKRGDEANEYTYKLFIWNDIQNPYIQSIMSRITDAGGAPEELPSPEEAPAE